MKYFFNTYKIAILFALIMMSSARVNAQVTFRATAPASVVQGEQFRLSYTLNKEGRDLRLPDMKGFEVLFGPSTSTSYSMSTVNGKTVSESSVTYTYILVASDEGTFDIEPATIKVDGSNYKSNSLKISVLPPDKTKSSGESTVSSQSSSGSAPTISDNDAFIRPIISKNGVYEQEGFTVTYRIYTVYNNVYFEDVEFPEFDGFMSEDFNISSNQQLKLERYKDRNYYTADLKKTLLFPQKSGKIIIPSGKFKSVFTVPSGKKVSTFFGNQEVMAEVKKTLVSAPITVDIKPLPDGKPLGFSNAVGSYSFNSEISSERVKANEPITVKVTISGTGNSKLIQNPEVVFPTNFETYDPTINNQLEASGTGLTGSRTIEYLAIPRYEGKYKIPSIEFSYFDPSSKSYKTLKSAEYNLDIEKGDPSKAATNSYVNQQNVKVEEDIRFIKTGKPQYQSKDLFFVGSLRYWMWYIIPFVVFVSFAVLNIKRAKENSNIKLVKTKRANKVAIKRLRVAEKHLRQHNKESFYDEILRALWGYFSDKLSIPVANLTKDNIESELSNYGIDESLIKEFTSILNTCEFARYAPVESDTAMDKLYDKTIKAIGEMENKLIIK